MVHVELVGSGTCRALPPAGSDGGPNAPVKPCPVRVSITRQGVTAINVIGPGAVKIVAAGCAVANAETSRFTMRCSVPCCSTSAGEGAQYNGAGQFFRGGFNGCCP